MQFTIQRFGTTKSGTAYPSTDEKRANDFFEWLSGLDENASGQRHTLPTGQQCTYLHHDIFGAGNEYAQDQGKWFYLPPSAVVFKAFGFWLSNFGRHVYLAVYCGEKAENALLFDSTPLQLILPPEGYKTPNDFSGAKIPLIQTVGVRAGERVDSLISDERSQSYIRIHAINGDKETLGLELGIPAASHVVLNPPQVAFNQMFAALKNG